MADVDPLRESLEQLFRSRGARLAYVFGSQATGRTHAGSDVDVAVLLPDTLMPDECFAERLALIGELSRLFRTDDVDLLLLNEAPPLLAYEVLRDGVLVYCADEEERIEFQVRTLRDYEDTEPLRQLLSDAMAERIRTGRFGMPAAGRARG